MTRKEKRNEKVSLLLEVMTSCYNNDKPLKLGDIIRTKIPGPANILDNMIKTGLVIKVRKGVYEWDTTKPSIHTARIIIEKAYRDYSIKRNVKSATPGKKQNFLGRIINKIKTIFKWKLK